MPRIENDSYNYYIPTKRLNAQVEKFNARFETCDPPFKQACHLIRKFGGIVPFAVAVDMHPQFIMNVWCGYKADRYEESVGLFPVPLLMFIVRAARTWGIYLTAADIYPDLIDVDNLVRVTKTDEEIKQWLQNILPDHTSNRAFQEMIALSVSTPE